MDNHVGHIKSDILRVLKNEKPIYYKKNDIVVLLNEEQKAYYEEVVLGKKIKQYDSIVAESIKERMEQKMLAKVGENNGK